MSDLSKRCRADIRVPGDIHEQAADTLDAKDAEIEQLQKIGGTLLDQYTEAVRDIVKLETIVEAARETDRAHQNNSGYEPSQSVLDRALDQQHETLKKLDAA